MTRSPEWANRFFIRKTYTYGDRRVGYLKSFFTTHQEPIKIQIRKHLNADSLFACVKKGFDQIPEHRTGGTEIPLGDAAMSAFAMFSLKDSSLLAFDKRRYSPAKLHNLQSVYGIKKVCCDSQMRTLLDPVDPDNFRSIFRDIFRSIQRGKKLAPMQVLDGHYLLALDGTSFFESKKLQSPHCLVKTNKETGEESYYQMMLGAAFVSPGYKGVIPLCPEMIIKQDGETKNDCERNAAKRFIKSYRREHPHLKTIVVEDGLSSNAPHIKVLEEHGIRYILGVKAGDHAFLFKQVGEAVAAGNAITEFCLEDDENSAISHCFRIVNDVALNKSNPGMRVNFLEYWEHTDKGDGEKVQRFSWVTDFTITEENACEIMRCGRARWRIENETFNTLKNQGYNFEHNFGLGEQHLSVNFALLMMLAFLVDQAQQLACPLFQAACAKLKSKKSLWEHMRGVFQDFLLDSMETFYRMMVYGYKVKEPEVLGSG